MKALVFGYGRSGKAAEALLCRLGFSVTVLDGDVAFPDGAYDVAVVSPGVALTHPWIVEARRRDIPLKSELQLGCEELKRQGWRLLAVTGSKGKSSVVKVVADAINLSGVRAVPCGNYGVPVCEVALSDGPVGWAVVEVSSFMMETTELPADTFEAAAILNLQEDHLDRHGSVEVYHGLKRKLLTMAKLQFDLSPYPDFEALYRAFLDDDVRDFLGGSYFDNDVLAPNGVAALTLMLQAAKVDRKTARRAFDEFVPLPHRMNLVAEIGGVRYVDDSKATSISALIAGVKMCQQGGFRHAPNWMRALCVGLGHSRCEQNPSSAPFVRLIAGGLPKGDDPKSALAVLTERVKKVYLIGQSAETFFVAWGGVVDCEICGTMDWAVERAMREAEKGETVLLSPGTASFDQFQSFGERGDVFARLVKKEG